MEEAILGKVTVGFGRITSWSNDQVLDIPSEIIFIKEEESQKAWSVTLNPMPDNNDYLVTYGFGFAKYEHTALEIGQELNVFIPMKEKAKINLLNLKNLSPRKKKLELIYYIKPVLGEDETLSNGNIELKKKTNTILLENRSGENKKIYYVSCSEEIKSYTGDRDFFIGDGTLLNPDALKKVELDNKNTLGNNNIIAIQMQIELDAFEDKKISIVLGEGESSDICLDNSYKYSNITKCSEELKNTKQFWEDFISNIQVNTPVESFNLLINGWLAYQTLSSRIWARTGFYQSGGAFGFRDQLQDTLGLKYYDVGLMKDQILKHASHQFIEGDVEHWWHEDTKRGIRTRFTDDLLWLVYTVCEYIEFTEDYSVLDIEVSYKNGDVLEEHLDEKYDIFEDSDIKESLYKHCIRAIEKSLKFGKHDLPLIGSGDWNDGLSTVGNKGKGESVWLGFFLYDVLKRFIPIIEKYKNIEEDSKEESLIDRYKNIQDRLKKSLNNDGWDGRWYKRAYTDSGEELRKS